MWAPTSLSEVLKMYWQSLWRPTPKETITPKEAFSVAARAWTIETCLSDHRNLCGPRIDTACGAGGLCPEGQ